MAGTIQNNKWIHKTQVADDVSLFSPLQDRMGDEVFDDSVEGENLTGEKDLLRMSQDLYKVHKAHTRGPVLGQLKWLLHS